MKQNALRTTSLAHHATNMPTLYLFYRLRFCFVPDSQYSNEEEDASKKLELKLVRGTFALILVHMIDLDVHKARWLSNNAMHKLVVLF